MCKSWNFLIFSGLNSLDTYFPTPLILPMSEWFNGLPNLPARYSDSMAYIFFLLLLEIHISCSFLLRLLFFFYSFSLLLIFFKEKLFILMESPVGGNIFLNAFYFRSGYSFKNTYLMRKVRIVNWVSVELLTKLNDCNTAEEWYSTPTSWLG